MDSRTMAFLFALLVIQSCLSCGGETINKITLHCHSDEECNFFCASHQGGCVHKVCICFPPATTEATTIAQNDHIK
ncbi:hypothetical protein ACJIZ3_024397 [Penstemon smallii]|uniref:Uncharacterized protein n=1 Tax=Penstemon smallii TaxID=265156 RepID=A0ABD3TTD2_9LAMI